MHNALLILLAIVAGVMLPIQAAMNSKISESLKDPIYATLVSFAVGTVGLLAYLLAARTPWGNVRDALQLPWFYWLGGILGIVYVAGIIILAPRLGVALTIGLTVAAQMIFSLVMDHYGLLGLKEVPINLPRLLGAVLIIAGVVLIQRN